MTRCRGTRAPMMDEPVAITDAKGLLDGGVANKPILAQFPRWKSQQDLPNRFALG